jgi:hypothetical protein
MKYSPQYYRWGLDEAYYYNWWDPSHAQKILIDLADEIIPRENGHGETPPSKEFKQKGKGKGKDKTNGHDVIDERITAAQERAWSERSSPYD